jgi:hypothetical protein
MELGKVYKRNSTGHNQLLVIPNEKVVIQRKVYNDLIHEHIFERTVDGKRYFVSFLGLKYIFLPCDELDKDGTVAVYKGEEVRTFKIVKFKKNPVLPMYKAVLELNGKTFLTQSLACKPDVEDKISYLCNRVKNLKTKNMILFSNP